MKLAGNDLSKISTSKSIWPERDKVENELYEFGKENQIPLLGICRGFQFLAEKMGCKLTKVEGHVNTLHEINIMGSFKPLLVNSYHSWSLEYSNIFKKIQIIATSSIDDTIEAYKVDKEIKAICFMWHPERRYGNPLFCKKLIDQFIKKIQ